jgi:hypothetical protein
MDSIFTFSPNNYLLTDLNGKIIAVNRAFLSSTDSKEADVLNQSLFSSPSICSSVSETARLNSLKEQFYFAISSKQIQNNPPQRYNASFSSVKCDQLERTWQSSCTPLPSSEGVLCKILYNLQNVTHITNINLQILRLSQLNESFKQQIIALTGQLNTINGPILTHNNNNLNNNKNHKNHNNHTSSSSIPNFSNPIVLNPYPSIYTSDLHMNRAFTFSPNNYLITDLKGKIINANYAFLANTESKRTDVINQSLFSSPSNSSTTVETARLKRVNQQFNDALFSLNHQQCPSQLYNASFSSVAPSQVNQFWESTYTPLPDAHGAAQNLLYTLHNSTHTMPQNLEYIQQSALGGNFGASSVTPFSTSTIQSLNFKSSSNTSVDINPGATSYCLSHESNRYGDCASTPSNLIMVYSGTTIQDLSSCIIAHFNKRPTALVLCNSGTHSTITSIISIAHANALNAENSNSVTNSVIAMVVPASSSERGAKVKVNIECFLYEDCCNLSNMQFSIVHVDKEMKADTISQSIIRSLKSVGSDKTNNNNSAHDNHNNNNSNSPTDGLIISVLDRHSKLIRLIMDSVSTCRQWLLSNHKQDLYVLPVNHNLKLRTLQLQLFTVPI